MIERKRTPLRSTAPAERAVGEDREKRQPYANENEDYDGAAVRSPSYSRFAWRGPGVPP